MFMRDHPSISNLAKTDGQTKVQPDVDSGRFRSGTAHQSRDEGDVRTVTVISRMSNIGGSSDQEKNVFQVSRYDSRPFDWGGGGTSNITMLREWLRRIPRMSLLRTELAQSCTSLRIAVSSLRRS